MASFEITRRDGSVHTVLVDDEDLGRVIAAGPWRVHAPNSGNTLYAIRDIYVDGKRTTQYLHRFLLDAGNFEIDHINCDGLDNRRANLRIATPSQNQHNRGAQRDNKSGYKGVTLDKRRGKWMAQIALEGKRRSLGLHATPELAHAAYCRAAAELHGKFARIA